MESYTQFQIRRRSEAALFGQRTANCVIAALLDDTDNADSHWRNWARVELQFVEWQYAARSPELLP